MRSRIPVVVVTGPPGSGKTGLIERLLRDESPGSIAVIARAQGSAPAAALYRLGGGFDVAPEGACPCCSLNSELAGALRDLFMAALRRRIPAPREVLVETAGQGDPAAILYCLHHDPFLRERYFYRGCITAVAAAQPLDAMGLRQAALADALVLGPAPAGEQQRRRALRSWLEEINPLALCFDADCLPDLAHILAGGDSQAAASMRAAAGAAAQAGTLWSGAHGGRLGAALGVAVLRLTGRCELSRPQFLRAMDVLRDACGARILRIAAMLRLRGEAGAWELRGVHRQLYWQAAASAAPAAVSEEVSTLLVVLEASAEKEFRRRAQALLTGLQAVAPAPRPPM